MKEKLLIYSDCSFEGNNGYIVFNKSDSVGCSIFLNAKYLPNFGHGVLFERKPKHLKQIKEIIKLLQSFVEGK